MLDRSLLGRGVPRSSGALRRIVAQRERVKGHRGESRVVASSESGQKSSRVFFESSFSGVPGSTLSFPSTRGVAGPRCGSIYRGTAKEGAQGTGVTDGLLATANPTHAHRLVRGFLFPCVWCHANDRDVPLLRRRALTANGCLVHVDRFDSREVQCTQIMLLETARHYCAVFLTTRGGEHSGTARLMMG